MSLLLYGMPMTVSRKGWIAINCSSLFLSLLLSVCSSLRELWKLVVVHIFFEQGSWVRSYASSSLIYEFGKQSEGVWKGKRRSRPCTLKRTGLLSVNSVVVAWRDTRPCRSETCAREKSSCAPLRSRPEVAFLELGPIWPISFSFVIVMVASRY
jgi:hypothetical protein